MPESVSLRDPQYAEQQAKFDASPIAEVTGKEIYSLDEPLPNRASIRERLITWLQERGWLKKFSNEDTGWNNIHVSKSSIRDIIAHGSKRGKIQAGAALPDIIKNGIYLETETLDNGLKRHVFAAKLNIAEEPLVIGFVVQEDRQGKKYYDHELTEMENLGSTSVSEERKQTRASRDSVMNIVRKHLGVNPAAAVLSLAHYMTDLGST
jgi:hypothetical protein